MASIFDLFEVTSISENTTYSTANGNLLGIIDDLTSDDLNDGEFDEGDDILIGGVFYNIDEIQEPSSTGTFTLGDGSTTSFSSGSESNLDVAFLTVSNGGTVRHFIIPNDSYGNVNVVSIQTGNIRDVAGSDAAIISTTNNNVNVVCFAAGTQIRTPDGEQAVETLEVGDEVLTLENGAQDVRAIIIRALDFPPDQDCLKPIKFEQDSLGAGRPDRPLFVSPQHRMLVEDQSGRSVLVPAKALIQRAGVRVAFGKSQVVYVHLVFSRHEIIYANGTLCESFFPGDMALRAIPDAQYAEICEIFGNDLVAKAEKSVPLAAPVLCFREAKEKALSFT